jgi:hypothetical protein
MEEAEVNVSVEERLEECEVLKGLRNGGDWRDSLKIVVLQVK